MIREAFTVFPAIDLFEGKVVRLKQGKRNNIETFNLDPERAAERWIIEGAKWLHIVNLDGAFGESCSKNIKGVRSILSVANGSAKVQLGGGLRDLSSIDFMLSLGISRVVLGTSAIKNAGLVKAAIKAFGSEVIILGVDAWEEKVHISGWQEETSVTPEVLINSFVSDGLHTIIYTNIQRDGMKAGVDIQSTCDIANKTGVKVIASGGVADLEDIILVKTAGLAGVIIGKALYDNNFKLSEALQC